MIGSRLVALLPAALSLAALAPPARGQPLYPAAAGWQSATPGEMGLDAAKIQQAIDYATQTNAAGGSGMIVYQGRLVSSWGSLTTLYDIKSSAKSFGAVLAGVAVDDGRIDLGDTVKSHLPTFGTAPGDRPAAANEAAWRSSITIEHLMTHTSGVNKSAATGNLLFAPGTAFSYSDNAFNRLADVLTVEFEQDLKATLQARVFDPIGVSTTDYSWRAPQDANEFAPNGTTPRGGYGATLADPITAYDDDANGSFGRREFGSGINIDVDAMARFGYLMLREGEWVGPDGEATQVLSAAFVDRMSTTTDTAGVPNAASEDARTYPDATANYGLGWWNNNGGAVGGLPSDAFWTWGLHDSFVMVVPSLDLVVARTGLLNKNWVADPRWGTFESMEPFFGPIVAAVPEPSSSAAAVGVAAALLGRRRRRTSAAAAAGHSRGRTTI